MAKILVTGGTVFVSRYIAEFYAAKGDDVYVLNRNTREQPKGVTLIEADRHDLGEILRPYSFDVVIDTAYTANDVELLLDALGGIWGLCSHQFQRGVSGVGAPAFPGGCAPGGEQVLGHLRNQ